MRVTVAIVAVMLEACVGTPHNDPSEISALEVGVYKKGLDMGCRDAGRDRGDSVAKVEAFCSCVLSTLNSRLGPDDWRRATFLAQQRRNQEERSVMAPHMQAVEACRTAK